MHDRFVLIALLASKCPLFTVKSFKRPSIGKWSHMKKVAFTTRHKHSRIRDAEVIAPVSF